MSKRITTGSVLTIGLDLGDRFTEGRVLDASGEVIEAFRVRTTEPALSARLAGFAPCRVVLEVGTHSPWVSRVVARQGHEAVVANPRRVRRLAFSWKALQLTRRRPRALYRGRCIRGGRDFRQREGRGGGSEKGRSVNQAFIPSMLLCSYALCSSF